MTDGFRITGRHVLFSLVGFFVVVASVNAVFITHAVSTFPGEQEKKSYMQGLDYNKTLARREAQARLGWSASLDEARVDANGASVRLQFLDAEDRPLDRLQLSGVLSRPADDNQDLAVDFTPLGGGAYEATGLSAAPGVWYLSAEAMAPSGDRFALKTKVYLQEQGVERAE